MYQRGCGRAARVRRGAYHRTGRGERVSGRGGRSPAGGRRTRLLRAGRQKLCHGRTHGGKGSVISCDIYEHKLEAHPGGCGAARTAEHPHHPCRTPPRRRGLGRHGGCGAVRRAVLRFRHHPQKPRDRLRIPAGLEASRFAGGDFTELRAVCAAGRHAGLFPCTILRRETRTWCAPFWSTTRISPLFRGRIRYAARGRTGWRLRCRPYMISTAFIAS